MGKKKKKFNLTKLVHKHQLSDGQQLFFVSDPSKSCKVTKQPDGEFKVTDSKGKTFTVHEFASKCLNTEPPDHASKWLRTEGGNTLYELWHAEDELDQAA